MHSAAPPASIAERRLVLLVAAVQFVNILDFMMVMPLGPDFATALGIPTAHIGVIGGSYTLAAAVSGLVASTFLDRFDRRRALAVAMAGLVFSTAAGGAATGLATLVGARILAGTFGGPATSISFAIVTDTVPPERRGRAMGTVMASFSAASVLGVPAGLEIARRFGWRAPFFAVALLGAAVTATSLLVMPPMRRHLEHAERRYVAPWSFAKGVPARSLAATFLTTLGVFSIIPNLSAYLQFNLGYPRSRLGLLYLVGGSVSFVAMAVTGRWVDRFGATRVVVAGTAIHLAVLAVGFIHPILAVPVILLFTAFMLSGSVRMVPMSSLSTRVPRPEERAGFMSAQSAVQHTGSALGALFGSFVLVSQADGRLLHMDQVASWAFAVAVAVPFLARWIEGEVAQTERAEHAESASPRVNTR